MDIEQGLRFSVTRLEVIDEKGRQLAMSDLKLVDLCIQDKGKTLKIFVKRGL